MKPGTGTEEPLIDAPRSAPSPHHKHIFAPEWAAVIGTLAIGLLYLALPERLTFGPNWLLLALEVFLLAPLIFTWMIGRPLRHITIRLLALALLAVVTLGLALSIAYLVRDITLPSFKHANILLSSAALLWSTNILVFALWYFEIDGGGPHQRIHLGHQAADFLFPQQVDGNKTGWTAQFVDYLFLAFTCATALSPADTFPLTRKAKTLMMIEATLSIIIIVLLAARAVNILGS